MLFLADCSSEAFCQSNDCKAAVVSVLKSIVYVSFLKIVVEIYSHLHLSLTSEFSG